MTSSGRTARRSPDTSSRRSWRACRGSETIRVEKVNAQRAPNVGIFDIRADKSFDLKRGGRLTAIVDIFNVTNSDVVTNFRITTVRYKEIIALLDPRIIRFGVRWEF